MLNYFPNNCPTCGKPYFYYGDCECTGSPSWCTCAKSANMFNNEPEDILEEQKKPKRKSLKNWMESFTDVVHVTFDPEGFAGCHWMISIDSLEKAVFVTDDPVKFFEDNTDILEALYAIS